MARGKSKPAVQVIQLGLFNDENSAEAREVEDQKQMTGSIKRGRIKKSMKPPVPVKKSAQEESKELPVSDALLPFEEPLVSQQSADLKLIEEREAELKARYKKNQEERLAALRKARGKK